ncbi:MAG: hypothetical protein GF400_09185 [Candidatus Eisenbacteria bacterium]|nr:hypothetical protein [Candidatus Eisenbacteria bacterium]
MLRTAIAVVVLSLLVVGTAIAGENPYIRAFVTMEPDDYVHSNPGAFPNTIVDVYLCFDTLSPYCGGITGFSLVLDFRCGGFVAGSADVSVFHPDAQTVIGGPDDVTNGWVVAAPECVRTTAPFGILPVARIPWYYLGPGGDILILASPVDGKATVDCNNDLDYFCVLSHGALGLEVQTPGDVDCEGWFAVPQAVCEPQGGDNPSHPPTYWYLTSPGYGQYMHGFHVQVLDPDIGNYTNWVQPNGWVHCDSITQVDDTYWVSWYDTLDDYMPEFGYSEFRFDNPNPASWAHWTITAGDNGHTCAPYAGMTHSSWDLPDVPDGCGYRVHAPTASTTVEEKSWGRIKALYR